MMTPDELRSRALAVRTKRLAVDGELLSRIESDIEEYRGFLAEPRPQLPPGALDDRLPLMGWLIYEVSLRPLWSVVPAFDSLDRDPHATSVAASALITRAADAARSLPWPEFAPRALGAIRAQALVASKRDTESGYDEAWILHQEARLKHASFTESHAVGGSRDRHLLALDEVLIQLALAEAGTACRTAERVIGRWSEGLGKGDWTGQDDNRWTQRMFRELSDGTLFGTQALEVAARIERGYGFVRAIDEHRLALMTSYQNPGIMTARAALLMLSMCPEMEALGRRPLGNHDSWSAMRVDLLTSIESAYRYIERPVVDAAGGRVALNVDHQRSIVQLRLHLALLAPGHSLPAAVSFDPCLELDPLDANAVEALSRWLAERVDGRQRGDANVIGSATKPSFIRSVEACRARGGAAGGYREWRRRWFVLDRYANESGRRELVEKVLAGDS